MKIPDESNFVENEVLGPIEFNDIDVPLTLDSGMTSMSIEADSIDGFSDIIAYAERKLGASTVELSEDGKKVTLEFGAPISREEAGDLMSQGINLSFEDEHEVVAPSNKQPYYRRHDRKKWRVKKNIGN